MEWEDNGFTDRSTFWKDHKNQQMSIRMEVVPVSDLNTQALLMLGMLVNCKSNFDWEAYSSTMVESKSGGNSLEDSALETSIAEKIDNLLLQVIIKDEFKRQAITWT